MSGKREGQISWRQARDETLAALRKLRQQLEAPDEVEILTAIHAACGLCNRSSAEKEQAIAAEGAIKCDYCIAFDQFGGCRIANERMTDRVLEKDWRGLAVLVDGFMAQVAKLELPPEEGGTTPESTRSSPPEQRGREGEEPD